MSDSAVGDRADSPRVARVAEEDAFGSLLRELIAKTGVKFVDVARHLAIRREDLYEVMDGSKHMRAAWLALLPPVVEIAYLQSRAAHHGYELAPVGDADSVHGRMHSVVAELSDVVRCAAVSEADGHLSLDEATEELRQIEEAERALSSRKALLRKAVESRGMRVVGGNR